MKKKLYRRLKSLHRVLLNITITVYLYSSFCWILSLLIWCFYIVIYGGLMGCSVDGFMGGRVSFFLIKVCGISFILHALSGGLVLYNYKEPIQSGKLIVYECKSKGEKINKEERHTGHKMGVKRG